VIRQKAAMFAAGPVVRLAGGDVLVSPGGGRGFTLCIHSLRGEPVRRLVGHGPARYPVTTLGLASGSWIVRVHSGGKMQQIVATSAH
jgi:hypothetical protein